MFAVRHVARQLNRYRTSHLIRVRLGYSESHKKVLLYPNFRRASTFQPHTMASLDSITSTLAALSIKPASSISHAATTSPAEWKEALIADNSTPKGFELIKTLVYKPKTAKTATPVPVVVIARDSTETNSGAIGKALNLKELRLASADLLTEFFSLDKDSCEYRFLFSFFLRHDLSSSNLPSQELWGLFSTVFTLFSLYNVFFL